MSVAPVAQVTPLSEVPLGVSAYIERVNTTQEMAGRLEGLGLCAGRTVRLVKKGDPCIVHVYGTRIGLAAPVAALIEVMTTTF